MQLIDYCAAMQLCSFHIYYISYYMFLYTFNWTLYVNVNKLFFTFLSTIWLYNLKCSLILNMYILLWTQFTGPTCGHHGPYTFYKAFKYRRHNAVSQLTDQKSDGGCWSTLSLGQFFYVRILPCSSICVGELQLVWESTGGAPGQMMASLKLYFRPEDTPPGRLSTHGQVRQ